jgi:O-antigen ligase
VLLGTPERPASGFAFLLFLLLNAALYLRPAEVVPWLRGVEIYQYIILLCLLVALPDVFKLLSPGFLEKRPIALCVLCLLPAILLSLLARLHFGDAATFGWIYLKVLLYFLLLLTLVDTPARVRTLCAWLAVFAAILAFLTILDWYDYIRLPKKLPRGWKEGDPLPNADDPDNKRLVGTGLFQDPNDLCLLIIVGILLGCYRLFDRRTGLLRFGWLVPLGVLFYGFALTRSRGGLLALCIALAVMVRLRWGWYRVLMLGALALPVLPFLLGARQTNIGSNVNTGQERIQLWAEALRLFRTSPICGIGMEKFTEEEGITHVAHNSYLTALAELGLIGGMLFIGAVYLAVRGLYNLGLPAPVKPGGKLIPRRILDPDAAALHPYLTGAVVGYAAGMMTLSLTYVIPTYTILGLAAAFLPLARTEPPTEAPRLDANLLCRLFGMSICFLFAMYVFVRLFFRP